MLYKCAHDVNASRMRYLYYTSIVSNAAVDLEILYFAFCPRDMRGMFVL